MAVMAYGSDRDGGTLSHCHTAAVLQSVVYVCIDSRSRESYFVPLQLSGNCLHNHRILYQVMHATTHCAACYDSKQYSV